jgi:FtsH-binding integral membrane protein
MNQFPGQSRGLPSQVGVRPTAALSAGFLSQSFTWMFAGLLLTAGIAYVVQSSPRLLDFGRELFLPALLVELGIAIGIQLLIRRISAVIALGLFFVYAAINGLTIGLIVSLYTTGSVAAAFLSAAGMFGGAAVYGVVTKRSLASIGGFLTMAIIGLVVAMLVNLFLQSSLISFAISIIGVGLFTVLTAYHVQRIASGDIAVMTGSMEKGAVFSALLLYLDFINIFLFMLRLFGGSGNRR